jgi:hypothetical protein
VSWSSNHGAKPEVAQPLLVASWFGANQQYERMARVLEHSARQHCPAWDIRVEHIAPARLESALRNEGHVENTHKMQHWANAVASADDGQQLLLMDADTMVLRPLDRLWDLDFDFAYTDRPGGRLPFNSGVVALRVSAATRAFVAEWLQEQLAMLAGCNRSGQHDPLYHRRYHSKFGGINQAALGRMLERRDEFGLNLRILQGHEWNAEDGCWQTVDANTRIVHVKSALRRAVFEDRTPAPWLVPIARTWHQLEAEAEACRTVRV